MSKDKLSVSVLIDSYNYGHYIEETIESVFSQTYPQEKIEIIVVDDGSSDDTSQRLEKYKDRIKFIEKENGGQASAFNTAFQHSIGDIVFLLDSDDIFYPDKIQEVCDTYEKHNCLCVFNLVELFGEHIDKQISSTTEYFLQFINKLDENLYKLSVADNFSSFLFMAETSGQSFKRELLEKIMPIPEEFIGSADLYLHVLPLIYDDIYFINKRLNGFRQHHESYRAVNYNNNSELKDIDTNFYQYTINSLQKYNDKNSKYLIKSLENRINYINYYMEKKSGNKLKSFCHLLKYKASQKSVIKRSIRKIDYILDLLIPEEVYQSLKNYSKTY
ncbi:MAG: glycosyltransferase [bacterium]